MFGSGKLNESSKIVRNGGYCTLCGKTRDQVKNLLLGVHGGVCYECIDLSYKIIHRIQDKNIEQAEERLQEILQNENEL